MSNDKGIGYLPTVPEIVAGDAQSCCTVILLEALVVKHHSIHWKQGEVDPISEQIYEMVLTKSSYIDNKNNK